MSQIITTAEPFLFRGGPIACLLIHGFTGTPKEMRWMGEYLASQGHTVLGIRLAGHATQPVNLIRTRWQDWLASVEDGYHLLQGISKHIFVAGLSLGGNLSLLLASRFPVAGVIAMSTPYALPDDWRLHYIKFFQYLIPSVPKGPPDWRNPEAARDHVDYPDYPTRSIIELRDLLTEMRGTLSEVSAPVLVVHSRDDENVPPENAQRIYNCLGISDKQIMWVENCGHVIIREPERQKIFDAAGTFIQRVTQASGIAR